MLFQENNNSHTVIVLIQLFCFCLSWHTSWSNLVGSDCTWNPCFHRDACVANAPVAGGIVCRCRLLHVYTNMTYKQNYTSCTSDYGPWGTYPVENGLAVEQPWFEYERLPDTSFTASAHYQKFKPEYGRIHTNEKSMGAWCAPTDNQVHWLQLDLGAKNKVTAVGTEPRAGVAVVFGVSSYKLSMSDDGVAFTVIQSGGSDRIFTGNTVKDKEVINFFDPPIETNYLRFIPETFISLKCMRVEVYGLKLVDECVNGWAQCDAKATCTDTIASYYCTCPVGYYDILGNGFVCMQVNECTNRRPEFKHNCSQYSTCEDTDGAFTCTCFTGYQGDGYYCEDINECETGAYQCHQDGHCVNVPSEYECACNVGFSGDGKTKCEDINECKKGFDCHIEAACENTIGSYKCNCRTGYSGNGKICTDVNECKFDIPMCHKYATCINTIGSYACNCLLGFIGSGRWCDDVNECEQAGTPLCTLDERCYNYPGGYVCMCPAIMPSQRPYKELERNILDQVLSDFRDTSIEDWKYPLDYHAHMIRTIYQLVMRTYNYRFKEVSYSFFIEKVAGNDFAVEMYDLRCTDVANVSFPNFCHDDYTHTEFRYFTDVVQMWLIREAIEPFETWATPPPLVAPNPLASTTTLMPLLTDAPQTTKIINVNGTNITMTEAPRTTSPPFRACGGNFSGNKGGYFTSPNYPNNYPPKSKCVWHIEAPESHNVYVRFHFFHLESDRKCFYDYVEIHDESADGPALARYCGQEYTTPIRSGRRKLVVIFYSDEYYEFPGFRAEWKTLSPRVSLTCITYNQMSTMPPSFRETWQDDIDHESDKSSYVPVSRLLACKQYPRCNHTRPGDVIFTLEHFRMDRNVKICIHWMLDQIGTTWTTRPCRVIKSNQTHTVCSCHTWGIVGVLGKFELWSPEELPSLFALGRNSFFSILLVAIALTITFLYLFLKDQWGAVIMQVFSMKEYDSGRIIQMHIVSSTLMAEITFSIITFNIRPTEVGCFLISAIFYYALQTVFFWLFIYTIFLQSRVKEVFDSEKYNSYKIYLFVGYGLPLFVTLAICSLSFNTVKNEKVCWLLFEGNSVWGFSGVIATLGVGSLVLLLNIIYNARNMEHGVILQEKCLRTIFTTFFVLLTSIFGARALQERTFFAEYVFSLCNLLQGYSIAIMYCVLRREDPIIKANQIGPISGFDKDDENLKTDEVEEFKDMESDAIDSDDSGECIQVENNEEEHKEPAVEVKRYIHVRDGSTIFLQLRGANDLDDNEEAELDLPIEVTTAVDGEGDEIDEGENGSGEDSDQEIMFRFDELAAMSNTQHEH